MIRTHRGAALALLTALCAACATPAPQDTVLPSFNPEAAVAAVRAAGGAASTELDVQPLRDPQVEDLRQQASRLETAHQYQQAAAALDQALQINAADPALLQERAEAALLLRSLGDAEGYAQRAYAGGSKVGPLCRRHWETIAQVRAARPQAAARDGQPPAPAATVADARRQRDACTVAAPNRF